MRTLRRCETLAVCQGSSIGGQVMFRLADVREAGGFALEYPSSEDYDLWVRLLRRGRIETLPLSRSESPPWALLSIIRGL